jgi:acyl-CoA dehydrogenase
MVLPFGRHRRGPSDRLTEACASILLEPSATRDRLTVDIFHSEGEHDGVARLERAFRLKVASHEVRERMRKSRVRDIGKARAQGLINDAEVIQLEELAKAVAAAIAVDDFAADELSPQQKSPGDVPSISMTQPSAAPMTQPSAAE